MLVHLAHPVKEKDESNNDEKDIWNVSKYWKDFKSPFDKIANSVKYISKLHDYLNLTPKLYKKVNARKAFQ